MSELEERINNKIKECKFNFLEIAGFQQEPMLAIKAGIAIGYQMACDDLINKVNKNDLQT